MTVAYRKIDLKKSVKMSVSFSQSGLSKMRMRYSQIPKKFTAWIILLYTISLPACKSEKNTSLQEARHTFCLAAHKQYQKLGASPLFASQTCSSTMVTVSFSPVGGSGIQVTETITVTFSRSMVPASLTLAGNLGSIAASPQWTTTTNPNDTLIINPASFWPIGAGQTLIYSVADTFGNSINSQQLTFTVLAITSDVTNPTVNITSPVHGANVKDIVTISADASDNLGIQKVEFYINNVLIHTDTTSPYSYAWNTRTEDNHLNKPLKAIAYDLNNNTATDDDTIVIPVNHKIYWLDTNSNQIFRANASAQADGSDFHQEVFASGLTNNSAFDMDERDQRLFVLEADAGTISRVNLDKTGLTVIGTAAGYSVTFDFRSTLVVDAVNKRIYFTSNNGTSLNVINYNGGAHVSYPGVLPPGSSLQDIDNDANHLYYIVDNGNAIRTDLNGGALFVVRPGSFQLPRAGSFNPKDGRFYFSGNLSEIFSQQNNGSGQISTNTGIQGLFGGIAYDPIENYVYVSDFTNGTGDPTPSPGNGRLIKFDPNITNPKVLATNLDAPYQLRLYRPDTVYSGTTDSTAPIVNITAPTTSSTLAGIINITVAAIDDTAIAKVEFYINNILVASDTSAPYEYSWDTRLAINFKNHSLKAIAYDLNNNTATDDDTNVMVENPALFWHEKGVQKIFSSNPDGSNKRIIVNEPLLNDSFDLDSANKKLLMVLENSGVFALFAANLDGSNRQQLVEFASNGIITSNQCSGPIVYPVAPSFVYFVAQGPGGPCARVYRYDQDANSLVIAHEAGNSIRLLEADTLNNQVIFYEEGLGSFHADLNFAGITNINPTLAFSGQLNLSNNLYYFVDENQNSVHHFTISNAGVGNFPLGGRISSGLAVSHLTGRLYFGDISQGNGLGIIFSTDLTGGSSQDLLSNLNDPVCLRFFD